MRSTIKKEKKKKKSFMAFAHITQETLPENAPVNILPQILPFWKRHVGEHIKGWCVERMAARCWRHCYYLEGHPPCPAQPTYGYADRPLRSTESNPFLWGLFDHSKTNWLLLPSSYFIKLFIHNPSRCGSCNPLSDLTVALVWFCSHCVSLTKKTFYTGALLLLKAQPISRIYHHHNNMVYVVISIERQVFKTYQKEKKN